MNKSIELTETQVALVDIAVRKYWGRCKKLIGLTGAGHETLHQCNEVLNLLSSPHQSLDDGYYEVVDGEIKPLSWSKGAMWE
jgi:hypothetical protein